jgi:hypothetical protein
MNKFFWLEETSMGEVHLRSAMGNVAEQCVSFVEPASGPYGASVVYRRNPAFRLLAGSEDEAISQFGDMITGRIKASQESVARDMNSLHYLERFRLITKHETYARYIGKRVDTAHGYGEFKGFYSSLSSSGYSDRPCENVPHIYMVFLENIKRLVGVERIEAI